MQRFRTPNGDSGMQVHTTTVFTLPPSCPVLVFVMSEINVLYCFDTNFWRLAAVSIASLMRTQKHPEHITIHCMVAPHTRGKRKIRKIIAGRGGKLVWRVIPPRENPYRGYDYSRWSPVIFYRLFACRVFPHLDKILYLDSDTLIQDDLTKLYNTDISKYAMGAVRDMAPTEVADNPNGKYVREFIAEHLKHGLYINSGVLLLNLPRMRECENDLLNVRVPLKYPDQDILNVGLDGKIRELPLCNNFIPEMPVSSKFKQRDIDTAQKHAIVHHFYAIKPYMYHPAFPKTYSEFYRVASQIGFYPEDFVNADMKRHQRRNKNKYDSTTNIPHLYLDKRGRLKLFGVFRV